MSAAATALVAFVATLATLAVNQPATTGAEPVVVLPRVTAALGGNPVDQSYSTTDVEAFVADWARSARGSYAVSGTMHRIRQSDSARLYGSPTMNLADSDISLDVHHHQNDQMELMRLGETVTVVDVMAGERACRLIDGRPWCDGSASGRRAYDLDGRRDTEIDGVLGQVQGPDAGHRVYPMAADEIEAELEIVLATSEAGRRPRCWEARALTGDRGHRWGRRAQFCFDPLTGAQTFRRIFGEHRIEVFIADDVAPGR